MVLTFILAIIAAILIAIVLAAVCVGGAGFIVIFADVIVCIFIMVLLCRWIFKKKKR